MYNYINKNGLHKMLSGLDAAKSWFQTKPEIFKILPDVFQNIVFGKKVQRGET